MIAIILVSINFIEPLASRHIANETWRIIVVLLVSFGVASPFMWALMAKRPNNMAYKELWLDKKYNRGPLLVIEIARNILGVLILAFWMNELVPKPVTLILAVGFAVLVMVLFSNGIQRFYQRLESRFTTNLNARDVAAAADDLVNTNLLQKNADIENNLGLWDAHITELEVNPQAEYIGKQLVELAWREKYGVNIAYIKRGDKLIHVPGRNNRLMPFDRIGIIATDAQTQSFIPVFDAVETVNSSELDIEDISLERVLVDEHSQIQGKDIRSSGLRERTDGLVIGIQRKESRILNPDSATVLEWGDLVWIVGNKKKIQELREQE